MKRISQINQISTLNLPYDISTALTIHLESCFEHKSEAEHFWAEYGTFLILIEETDSPEWIGKMDEKDDYWLDSVINFPEYVLLLGTTQPYLLALSIIDDAGAGAYVLIPLSHNSPCVATLKNHLNNANT